MKKRKINEFHFVQNVKIQFFFINSFVPFTTCALADCVNNYVRDFLKFFLLCKYKNITCSETIYIAWFLEGLFSQTHVFLLLIQDWTPF